MALIRGHQSQHPSLTVHTAEENGVFGRSKYSYFESCIHPFTPQPKIKFQHCLWKMSEDEFDFISHNFEQTCPAAFRRLWKETDLSDVTLVSEDGAQIPVHKIILASCSLFFKDLLSRNKCCNSLSQ